MSRWIARSQNQFFALNAAVFMGWNQQEKEAAFWESICRQLGTFILIASLVLFPIARWLRSPATAALSFVLTVIAVLTILIGKYRFVTSRSDERLQALIAEGRWPINYFAKVEAKRRRSTK